MRRGKIRYKQVVEKLLTVKEVLQKLRVSRATLYRYLKDGFLPSYKIRGKRRFKMSDLEKKVSEGLDKK